MTSKNKNIIMEYNNKATAMKKKEIQIPKLD